MNNRAIYEALASDVTDGNNNPIADLTPFANYTVRDAIMVAGCEDDTFTQVLSIKVVNTISEDVKNDKPITQAHIEALATVHHLNTMWAYTPVVEQVRETANSLIAKYDLELPNLVRLTDRILSAGWDLTSTREGVLVGLKDSVQAGLDVEVEA